MYTVKTTVYTTERNLEWSMESQNYSVLYTTECDLGQVYKFKMTVYSTESDLEWSVESQNYSVYNRT